MMRFPPFFKTSLGVRLLRGGLVLLIAVGLVLSGVAQPFLSGFDVRQLVAILVVQPIILIGLALQGVRHALLIDRPGLSYLAATKAVALSQGLNLLLPARLSEVLKATYLRDRAGVPMSAGLSAVLLERTVDLIIVGFLGGVCLFFFAAMVSKTLIFVAFVFVAGVVALALWGQRKVLGLARALPWPKIGEFLERGYLHFSSSLRRPKFLVSLGLGVFIWGLSFFNIFLLIEFAGSIPIGLYGALLVFVCTTMGGAIPALPGGLGTYEAAAVFALMSLGYPFSDALILAVTIHVAQLVLPLILALMVMLTERLGLSSLISDLRSDVASRRE
ncbi:MAG: lysylphosphatidylglycerol synthase transmembrane domain-containing protein [Acidovorax sp.]|nr:lysylphosphatidylglycerol synthase transmembrane domain-containing protein [Acidovorax sp.]